MLTKEGTSQNNYERFPTQEIGSIAKPSWRVKGVADHPNIKESDIRDADNWGQKLGVPNYSDLTNLLERRKGDGSHLSESDKDAIRNWSVKYVLSLFEKAGLDIVYSGEQWRVEMYEHLVRNVQGFKLLGSVHSFDYKYYTKAAVVSPPRFLRPIHLEEFEFVRANTKKRIKLPITGPYTVVDWSFNEFYEDRLRNQQASQEAIDLRRIYFEARREFILSFVHDVLRPEISSLVKSGVDWIQIDEPAITTRPDGAEMELFVEAINELTSGFTSCKFSVHNCYSDYKLLAKYAPRLKDITQLALEFANRDSTNLGADLVARPGYRDLLYFEEEGYEGEFGLGVVHVHDFSGAPGNGADAEGRNVLESPELVRDRILVAAKTLKDPARVFVNPDCGLRTRSWEVAYEKLSAVTRGAALARDQVR